MACENQVGVRNISFTFFDCDTGQTYGPLSHELSGDEQPMYKLCPYTNEALPGGFVKRTKGNNTFKLSVIRNLGIPLALYQGCASVNVTVEHFNGMILTGLNGTGTGDEESNGHEVGMTITFADVDEFLPEDVESVTTAA